MLLSYVILRLNGEKGVRRRDGDLSILLLEEHKALHNPEETVSIPKMTVPALPEPLAPFPPISPPETIVRADLDDPLIMQE